MRGRTNSPTLLSPGGVARGMTEPPRTDAFVPGPHLHRPPTGTGPLNGLSFAAKDTFDVAAARKSSGNPDWRRTHPPAARSSPVIEQLLAAGARLEGKTVLDELAFGVQGENEFYGTPLNPRAPDRTPGGSSSGSASAVARALVDFALGTDTGGSTRVPASYCGIFGMRPTTGRISLGGVTPLAPSFDTVGWFARDGSLLARVGSVLLGEPTGVAPYRFLWAADAFEIAGPRVTQELRSRAHELFGPMEEIRIYPDLPARAYQTYRTISAFEAWQVHGPWITEAQPRFASVIAGRFHDASMVTRAAAEAAYGDRKQFQSVVRAAIPAGTAIVVPAAPGPAPRLREDPPTDPVASRERIISLEAIATLGGLPELAIPLGSVDDAPVGLGLIGAEGADSSLLALAASGAVARAVR